MCTVGCFQSPFTTYKTRLVPLSYKATGMASWDCSFPDVFKFKHWEPNGDLYENNHWKVSKHECELLPYTV